MYWVAPFAEGLYVEQIEADITSAREALANASAGIDKVCKELKSLSDKVAKSEVGDIPRADPWYYNSSDRPSMTRLCVVFTRSA
jgi:hypothetical protein